MQTQKFATDARKRIEIVYNNKRVRHTTKLDKNNAL